MNLDAVFFYQNKFVNFASIRNQSKYKVLKKTDFYEKK